MYTTDLKNASTLSFYGGFSVNPRRSFTPLNKSLQDDVRMHDDKAHCRESSALICDLLQSLQHRKSGVKKKKKRARANGNC